VRQAYGISEENLKRSIRTPSLAFQDNIKKDVYETRRTGMDWIQLTFE
jgi:hypothetical protein